MTIVEPTETDHGHLQAFLRAEEAATELVDQLVQLRSETEHYRTARAALEETAHEVAGSAGNLASLTARVAEVLETLRSIGTPELLSGQQQVAASVDGLATGVAGLERTVLGLDRTVGERLTAAGAELEAIRADLAAAGQEQARRQQALDQTIGRLPTAQMMLDMQQTLERTLAEHAQGQQAARAAIERVATSVDGTAAAVRGLRSLAITFFLVLLAAIGILGALAIGPRP